MRLRFVRYSIVALIALCTGAAAGADDASLEKALKQARVQGKYRMLLRQISVPADMAGYGEFTDYGPYSGTSWAGHHDLPPGHWVYVHPHWYIWGQRIEDAPPEKRSWGPEQATGEPDTMEAGDIPTAWASRAPDEAEEWLMLEYPEPVQPAAIRIFETFNPGSISRVTVFRLDGEEVELWKGAPEPGRAGDKRETKLPVEADFKTNRIKITLASAAVPGWNEIDAAGIVDASGKTHWASAAAASSTYAEPAVVEEPRDRLEVLLEEVAALRERLNQVDAELRAKLNEIEAEVRKQRRSERRTPKHEG